MVKKKTKSTSKRVTIKNQGDNWYTINVGGKAVAWARGKGDAKRKANYIKEEQANRK